MLISRISYECRWGLTALYPTKALCFRCYNSPHRVYYTRPRQIICHTMLSYLNVAIVKIPFRSRVMGFSNNCLLFLFSWERRFSTGNSGTGESSTLYHKQTISGEEMHTLITFMVSVMASLI